MRAAAATLRLEWPRVESLRLATADEGTLWVTCITRDSFRHGMQLCGTVRWAADANADKHDWVRPPSTAYLPLEPVACLNGM